MFALHQAWLRLLNNERVTTLCKAAVADCLGPQRESDENDNDYSRRCSKTRNQDNIAFETAWKRTYILGSDTESTITPESLTKSLREIADTQWQKKFQENLSATDIDRYENPGMYPSIIGDLWDCGERKIQRLFSRINEMEQTKQYLKTERTPKQQARIRGKLNKMANIPLQAMPTRPQTRFSNEERKTILNDRLQLPMVMGFNIQHQTCKIMQNPNWRRKTLPSLPNIKRNAGNP
jgi:hypothetical protein